MSSPRTRSARRLRATTILASLALLAGLVAAPSVTAAAATLYVGPGGGPGPCSAPAYATIQPAVTAASAGDTIHICAGTYTLAATVTVGVDLSFVGDGAVTTIIDGASAYRILDAPDTATAYRTISISGLTLRNGHTIGWGGAISAKTVTVADSVFTGNSALVGGAIGAGTVTVTNSTFSGNSAAAMGGAIAAQFIVTVTSSSFSGNSAEEGGAIYAYDMTATDSTFTSNTSHWGGAIAASAVTVADSAFSGNTSTTNASPNSGAGGAVVAGALTVTRSSLSGNTAASAGGAAMVGGPITITDSTFTGNTAGDWGGAIWHGATTTYDTIVRGSTFSGNTAKEGGAIRSLSAVTAVNSTFSENSATGPAGAGYGGAVYAPSATLTSSTFSGNTATTDGGSIYAVDTATLANTILAQASATNNCVGTVVDGGGNFSTDASCAFTVTSSQVVPLADLALGAVADNGGPTQTIALGSGSVASGAGLDAVCAAAPVNGVDQRGVSRPQGVSHCDAGAYEAGGTHYVALTPPATGGGTCAAPDYNTIAAAVAAASSVDAIHICAGTYMLPASVSVPVDLAFVGDGAEATIVDGASAYRIFDANGQTISVSGLTLRNGGSAPTDTDSGWGGAIRAATVTVTDSVVSGNAAIGNGGAISADGLDPVSVTVTNSSFSDNTSGPNLGGAIYSQNSSVSVTGSTFSGNSSGTPGVTGGYGGAIYAPWGPNTVTDSTFSGNSTGLGGGAIWGDTTATGSTFSGNTADVGGAIDAYNVTVSNSTFSGNSAIEKDGTGGYGGAIHADTVTALNSTFSWNTGPTDGGAISTMWGSNRAVTLTNSILAQPSAANNCDGTTFTDGGGNFSTDASCGFAATTLADLDLGTLADNGGPTATIALGVASVAIGAGLDAACEAAPVNGVDQRGVPRPQGLQCDAGAYEVTPLPAVTSVSPRSGPTAGGTTVTITGVEFTGATAVSFGATAAASFSVGRGGTLITTTSPAWTGDAERMAVHVTVTTPNGTSETSRFDLFTYVSPTPVVTSISPTSGPTTGGTPVTITGSGFTGATAVHFGATVTTWSSVVSDTSMLAMSPAGTGAVDVTVTNPEGTSTTSSVDLFTYEAVAAPAVTSIDPTSGPPAGGTLVTITGTGFAGATGVSFGTTAARGFSASIDGTTILATSPAGSGTVDVTVTGPGGTSATSGADLFTYDAPPAPVSYPAVIRAGVWYLRESNTSTPGSITSFAYGAPADVPVFGDWDGDGTKTPGLVRVTGGSLTWYLRNANSAGAPDLVFGWGAATDRPLVGDWDGDGVDSIGLLRGNWWLLRNSNSAGPVDTNFFWGIATDVPLVGDWDGNGTDTPGWLRCLGASCTPGHGNWWILRNSNSDGPADLDFFWGRTYEENAWVVGDWDGDGDDNPGILRAEWWLLRAANSDGPTTSDFFFGLPTDTFRVWAR